MPAQKRTKCRRRPIVPTNPDILDVRGAAAEIGVSVDTVYEMLKHGELPVRKVGRVWRTTRSAVLRWIERSSEHDTLARAIEGGEQQALAKALHSGKARVRKKQ